MSSSSHLAVEPAADLLAEVRPRALGDGRYQATLGPAWSFALPSGGVLTSIALAAMAAELDDPALAPISSTTIFASALREGPLDVQVTVLRRGKAASQLRAHLGNPGGDAGLEVSATFARPRRGPGFTGPVMPEVPAPAAAPDLASSHARWAFFRQLDIRLARGARVWEPGEVPPGPPTMARWFRYRVAPRSASGTIDRLAFPPLLDTMPGAIMQRLGSAGPRFYAPSLDLTVHFVGDTTDEWLLVESFATRVFHGYASCDAHLWSEGGELVAYASQTMIMKLLP